MLIFLIGLLNVVLFMGGCANNKTNKIVYVELTKNTFQELDISKVISVSVVSIPHGKERVPHEWEMNYTNVFPIMDPERIKTIHRLIINGKPINYSADEKILFETKKVIYYLAFGETHEKAYGDWWESSELMEKFKQWGIQHPRGEKHPPESITEPPWPAPEEGMLK